MSETVSVAERDPAAPGVNFTGIVTVPPFAATCTGGTDVVEKSLVLLPEKLRDVT